MKKKILILSIFCMLIFTACGKDTEKIVAFQNKLFSCVSKIESLHNELNNLDANASDAASVALDKLSELDEAFKVLAEIEFADEEFSYLAALADEGAEYMSQAYELFDETYNQDTFDKQNADLAYKYLERATTRVRVIVSMLHGEVPDEVTVH